MRLRSVAPLAVLVLACSAPKALPVAPEPMVSPPRTPPVPAATAATVAPVAPVAPVAGNELPPLHFVENDFPAAIARARAEHKALFLDAWAPWCHTCLSMQRYVLTDPSLRLLAARVVFASIDTDRPESAAFLERHHIGAWPTFFVLDPAHEEVVGYQAGSGSAREMRELIEEGLSEMAGGARDAASVAFSEGRSAQASGKMAEAAKAFARAITASKPDWPYRSAAVVGRIESLIGTHAFGECAKEGTAHLDEVSGSSAPADLASYLMTCASELPPGPERDKAITASVRRLRDFTAHPPAEASVDDKADALDVLSEGLASTGDAAGARAAQERRLVLLEEAARAAGTPELAQTFDYSRANTYIALGRVGEAIAMLEQRERELPGSYEPPARLADALAKAGKLAEARAAIMRAIPRAYGPRKLRYLKLRGELEAKLGERDAALATLKEEVAGYVALPRGQANPERLADARGRLAAFTSGKR